MTKTEMKTRNFQVHEKLATYLSKKAVSVDHGNYPTAAVDLSSNTILLPTYDIDTPEDVYNTMIAHEVGHIRFTPPSGWHDSEEDHGISKVLLNIIEDVRIEKLIKREFSALYSIFHRGYKHLVEEKDFFKTSGRNMEKTFFLEKLNVRAKVGNLVDIPFSEEEQTLFDFIMGVETWDDVIYVCKLLQEKFEIPEEYMSMGTEITIDMGEGDEGDSQGQAPEDPVDRDGNPLKGRTVEATEEIVKALEAMGIDDLVGEGGVKETETSLKNVPTRVFEVDVDGIMSMVSKSSSGSGYGSYKYDWFIKQHNPFISRMISEFNLRKNAKAVRKVRRANTGKIDVKKLATYQVCDDIFRKSVVVEREKNHASQLFIDFSGSMNGSRIEAVLKQTAIIAEFCHRLNIPFAAYGWGSGWSYDSSRLVGNINFGSFRMEVLVDTTSSSYKADMSRMLSMSAWNSSTPLTDAKFAAVTVANMFKARHNIDKLHIMFLTDGEGDRDFLDVKDHGGSKSSNYLFKVGSVSKMYQFNRKVCDDEALDHILKDMCGSYTGYFVEYAHELFETEEREGFSSYYRISDARLSKNRLDHRETMAYKKLCSHLARNIA